jgi:hypothetical protein
MTRIRPMATSVYLRRAEWSCRQSTRSPTRCSSPPPFRWNGSSSDLLLLCDCSWTILHLLWDWTKLCCGTHSTWRPPCRWRTWRRRCCKKPSKKNIPICSTAISTTESTASNLRLPVKILHLPALLLCVGNACRPFQLIEIITANYYVFRGYHNS